MDCRIVGSGWPGHANMTITMTSLTFFNNWSIYVADNSTYITISQSHDIPETILTRVRRTSYPPNATQKMMDATATQTAIEREKSRSKKQRSAKMYTHTIQKTGQNSDSARVEKAGPISEPAVCKLKVFQSWMGFGKDKSCWGQDPISWSSKNSSKIA